MRPDDEPDLTDDELNALAAAMLPVILPWHLRLAPLRPQPQDPS